MAKQAYPDKIVNKFLITIVVIYFSVFIFFPVGGMFFGAFEHGVQVFWKEVTRPEALNAFKLTGLITFVVTLINMVVGTTLAIILVRHPFRGAGILNGIIDLPFSISPVVAGFMLILLYGPNGILGVFFENLNVKIVFALPSMIIATLFITLPFVVREVSLVLEEMGQEEEEAAGMLGASRWQIFWKVTFPGIRWGLLYGLSLNIARCLGEFGAVLVVSGNIINSTQTATLHIFQSYVDYNHFGAYSVSAVLAIISISILLALELIKKRKRGGRK